MEFTRTAATREGDAPTRDRVARAILENGPSTAADLARLLDRLYSSGWIASGAVVVVERPTRDPESPFPPGWPEPRRRPYGDTVLWYGRVASVGTDDAQEGV